MLKPSTILSRFLCVMLVLVSITLTAQVRTQRFGQPKNLQLYGILGTTPARPKLNFPAVNVAQMQAQDEQDAKNGLPFRFGTNRDVSINVLDAATKSQRGGYQVYEYSITSIGAFSLNLIFDQFRLKKGSKLFLYNSDRTMIIGPVTDAQNISTGEYWTDLVQGSTLNIELQEPIGGSGTSNVHLKSVIHGYKNLFPDKSFGDAGTCHPNMVCYPAFQNEGDGVAMIVLANGSRLCSGSMVNNMRQTFRSFFLSANHCMSSPAEVPNWLVRFNYQSATCTPSAEDLDVYTTVNGSTYLANSDASDFVLIELSSQVPTTADITYNGWNRGSATTSDNFGIHHPRGDVKKISFTNADTQLYGWGVPGTDHVISFWGSLGVTDPGSSGSPLFDGNRRIVGQLHGGPSVCGATGADLRDYYGRFYTSWTGGGTNTTRLSNWLDPDNSVGTTTDGVKPVVSGPTNLASPNTFALNTLNSSVVSWSVTGGAGLVSPTSGTGNSANLTPLGTGSSVTITFTVNDGQSYPIVFSKEFSTTLCLTASAGTSTPSVCVGGTITLTSSGGSTYTWAGPAGSGYSSNSQNPTGFTATTTSFGGVYTVSAATTGCTATATTSVLVNALPAAVAGKTSAGTICVGGTITLTSSGGSTYTWAGPAGSGYSSNSQNPTGFTATTTSFSGVYTLSVSATTSCTATATTSVSVNALPVVTLGYAPICLVGNPLSLSASGGVSYSWKGPNGFSSANASPAKKSQAADAGIYSVTITNANSCTASATIEVYLGAGTISATSNSPVCKGGTIQLSASATHGVSYKWTKLGSAKVWLGANISISNAKTANAGLYTVWVTGDNGCISKEEVLVSVIPCPGTRLASEEVEEIGMEINAYPNPVTNTLTVEVTLQKPSKLSLKLFNSIGKESGTWLLNEEVTFHKTELNMSDLTGGVYLLQGQAGKQKVVKRVVKIQY